MNGWTTQSERIHRAEQSLFSRMPEWAKKAYHNDPTVHAAVRECLRREAGTEEIIWSICAALHEERNHFRTMAAESLDSKPWVVTIPACDRCHGSGEVVDIRRGCDVGLMPCPKCKEAK